MNFGPGFVHGAYWGRPGGRFRNREQLLYWQHKRLKSHLRFAQARSSFYRGAAPLGAELCEFPVMDKEVLMENFDTINTAGLTKNEAFLVARRAETTRDFVPKLRRYTVGLSSGTSQRRGLFAVSDYERGFWAGYILRRMLPGSLLARERIALFLRAGSNLYAGVASGRNRFMLFDLKASFALNLERLAEYRPTVLLAPPSVLGLLTSHSKSLQINPALIISIADVLSPSEKLLFESVWRCPIHQIYQATEGLLALTCRAGGIHLNEDLVYFERETLGCGRFVPIITDLRRRSVPLIRYRLNDILIDADSPCPCGSPFASVAQIEGRADELLFGLSSGDRKLYPIFPDFIRGVVGDALDSGNGLGEFRVSQQAPRRLTVALTTGTATPALEQRITSRITSLFMEHGCAPPDVTFENIRAQPLDQKSRRVTRSFTGEAGQLWSAEHNDV